MDLSDFDFTLPPSLIAQYPLRRREQARLMIIDKKSGTIRHDHFANLGQYLPKNSYIVLNDSKVVAARLLGNKLSTGGKIEVFLLNKLADGYSYKALLRPLRRVHNGETITFNGSATQAVVVDWEKRIVRFNRKDISDFLRRKGHMPLPPYIKRPDESIDRQFYQTVYAKREGSVASPTAGLHFTNQLLYQLKEKGHEARMVTLHVNYATFKAVEEEDITKHKMHSEEFSVNPGTFKAIKNAKEKSRAIVAIGTTSCRVLETVAKDGILDGSTNIFIYPGYQFKMTDILVTNFHLPYSTLLMLVYAFGGKDLIAGAYREAIEKKYRFYSYGDAMMIL